MNQPSQQIVVIENSTNGLGLAGLIFSCIGWLTCGLLCIPGALLSFFGLFSKPRGTAIAGLIVGFPGVLFFVFAGMAMIAGFLGLGAASVAVTQTIEAERLAKQEAISSEGVNELIQDPLESESTSTELSSSIASEISNGQSDLPVISTSEDEEDLPEIGRSNQPETRDSSQNPEPITDIRTFTDATGKFTVKAKVVEYKSGWVSLERADNGKSVKIQVEKLSKSDQEWLKEHFGDE